MAAPEEIAAVISALMNTSGGVVAICIDASRCQKAFCLKESNDKIVEIITKGEKWIPGIVFATFVKPRVLVERHEIVFFVNKSNHFVTHYTNAYHYDGNEVKPLLEYQSVCNIIRDCSCTDESLCHHNLNTTVKLTSSLSGAPLNSEMPYLPLEGSTCKNKAYGLQRRNLVDVLKSASVQDGVRKIVSALANGDGGSLLLGVSDTDTPVVKGCTWDSTSSCTRQEVEKLLSEIIDVTDHSRSKLVLDKKQWKLFFHPVVGCEDDRVVIEIRVQRCVGGMFCSMPLAFVINTSGEISALGDFWKWKETMLQSFKEVPRENVTVEDHFQMEITEPEPTVQSHARPDQQPEESNITPSGRKRTQAKETHRDKVFQWWATESDDVRGNHIALTIVVQVTLRQR